MSNPIVIAASALADPERKKIGARKARERPHNGMAVAAKSTPVYEATKMANGAPTKPTSRRAASPLGIGMCDAPGNPSVRACIAAVRPAKPPNTVRPHAPTDMGDRVLKTRNI